MPDLGKAVYTLIIDDKQYTAGMAGAEARADAATKKIAASMGVADEAIASVGGTADATAEQLALFETEATGAMQAVGASAVAMGGEVAAGAAVAAAGSEKAAAGTVSSWSRASKAIGGAGKSMRSVGKSLSHHITLPVAAIAGVGAKMFVDYSAKIRLLQTQAGASAKEMDIFRNSILNLAKDTVQGPQELSAAMFRVQSDIKQVAGHVATTADKMAILKVASQGAQVGMAGLDETTYALVSTLNTGLKGTENISQAMGSMNAIVGAGDMHMEDLTAALSTGVLPTARSAGITLNELGAAIATFTSRGQPAQATATRLGMAINLMQSPSKEAAKALAGIGVGSLDLARIMRSRGLIPALEFLRTKLSKVKDEAVRNKIILDAFGGGRSGKSMLTMLQSLDDMKERYAQITRGAHGFSAAVIASNKEPINIIKKDWSAIQVSLIKIGAIVFPIFDSILKGTEKAAAIFERMPKGAQKLVVVLGLVLGALGPIITMAGMLAMAIGAITLPVLGVVLAIVGIGAALVFLYYKFTWFRNAVNGTFNFIRHHWKALVAVLIVMFAPFLILPIEIIRHWRGVWNWLRKFAGDLAMLFSNPIKAIELLFGDLATATKGVFSALAADITSVFGTAINFIIQKINWVIDQYNKIASVIGADIGRIGLLNTQGVVGQGTIDKAIHKNFQKAAASGFAGSAAQSVLVREQATEGTVSGDGKKATVKMIPKAKPPSGYTGGASDYSGVPGVGGGLGGDGTKKKKKKKGSASRHDSLIPPRIDIQIARAERTKDLKDDMKAWKVEENYLLGLLKNKKLELKRRAQIEDELTRVMNKLAALRKKEAKLLTTDQKSLREIQAAMELRGTFFGEFAPNIFHATTKGLALGSAGVGNGRDGKGDVTVHQHNNYHEIPKDRHKQARDMRLAASAAMSGG